MIIEFTIKRNNATISGFVDADEIELVDRINELNDENKKLKLKNMLLKKEIAHLENKLAYKDQHNTEKFRGIEDWARGGF